MHTFNNLTIHVLTGLGNLHNVSPSSSLQTLTTSCLFHRAVYVRLGIWLFMSEMPYGTLSSSMLWKIFYIMQCAEMDGLDKLGCSLSVDNCIQSLQGDCALLT